MYTRVTLENMVLRNGPKIAKTSISRGSADWKIPPVHVGMVSDFVLKNQVDKVFSFVKSASGHYLRSCNDFLVLI